MFVCLRQGYLGTKTCIFNAKLFLVVGYMLGISLLNKRKTLTSNELDLIYSLLSSSAT